MRVSVTGVTNPVNAILASSTTLVPADVRPTFAVTSAGFVRIRHHHAQTRQTSIRHVYGLMTFSRRCSIVPYPRAGGLPTGPRSPSSKPNNLEALRPESGKPSIRVPSSVAPGVGRAAGSARLRWTRPALGFEAPAAGNLSQKPQHLLVSVLSIGLADHLSRSHVQRREPRGGTVTFVVVCHRRAAPPLHRQTGLRAVQGLDLALLVKAEHRGVVRWVEVQPLRHRATSPQSAGHC